MSFASCLYQGKVYHQRYQPAEHAFTYKVAMLYLNLNELTALSQAFWCFSHNKFNLLALNDVDYITPSQQSLSTKVMALLAEADFDKPIKDIYLLTPLRYWGYYFSPLCVFYLYDDAAHLQGAILEVTNTPWGEKHCYILDKRCQTQGPEGRLYQLPKQLHVSPFMPMDLQHKIHLNPPGENLNLRIDDCRESTVTFTAGLHLRRSPLNRTELRKYIWRQPLYTHKVITAIYWQAFKLFLKRIPFYPHP